MKKFRAPAGAFLLVAMLAAFVGMAVYADVSMYTEQVPIRRAQAALIGGYVDSAYVSHTGAVTDTSAPFTLRGRQSNFPTADTSLALIVSMSITSNATTTAAGSTVTLTLQGTFDGVTWVSAPAYVASELGNGSGLMEVKPYNFSGAFPVVAALTDNNMGIFQTYRVIAAHASGQVGTMALRVSWPRMSQSPNW